MIGQYPPTGRGGCRRPPAHRAGAAGDRKPFGVADDDVRVMRELQLHFRMDRRQIAFFRFLLEAYDGLALLRTLDPVEGRVVLYLSESCKEELDDLIRALSGEIRLEPADPDLVRTVDRNPR
ncbi:MAG: DUF4911 domain-containing protein [Desulfobacterales bacterium]